MYRSMNDPAQKLYIIINPEYLPAGALEEMMNFYKSHIVASKEKIKNLKSTPKGNQKD
jgi:hypothetical protein